MKKFITIIMILFNTSILKPSGSNLASPQNITDLEAITNQKINIKNKIKELRKIVAIIKKSQRIDPLSNAARNRMLAARLSAIIKIIKDFFLLFYDLDKQEKTLKTKIAAEKAIDKSNQEAKEKLEKEKLEQQQEAEEARLEQERLDQQQREEQARLAQERERLERERLERERLDRERLAQQEENKF